MRPCCVRQPLSLGKLWTGSSWSLQGSRLPFRCPEISVLSPVASKVPSSWKEVSFLYETSFWFCFVLFFFSLFSRVSDQRSDGSWICLLFRLVFTKWAIHVLSKGVCQAPCELRKSLARVVL